MATFTYTPEFGAAVTHKPTVRAVKFGDGYEQRLAYGINTNPRVWDLRFASRSNTEADAILAFLEARGAVESFDWTPPSGSAGKWICREWSRTMDRYNLNTVQAKFEEVFEA